MGDEASQNEKTEGEYHSAGKNIDKEQTKG